MRALTAILLASLVFGCDAFRARKVEPPPVLSLRDDDDHLDWAAAEPWAVVIRRRCRTLDVYRHGDRVRSFPAVFGLSSSGKKLHEGDLRTPTGLYMIVDKRRHYRWEYFLLLDYPNAHDRERYWEALEAGRIGTRHCTVLALDALAKARGANAALFPLLRVAAATADRDKAFWDLHHNFRNAPPFLALFPNEERLRQASAQGEREFEETARLLPPLLAPVPPWKDLAPDEIADKDEFFA